ncbi:uncharacterized protein LOC111012585 isoform X2 [Momordica charantia]|uniref:Histidine-containing phosphotransfer protein n=1 Tax=Momordica charantia TaxID=3673 RepID=A0A6J1CM99_MOMCH|nr:uncharacterized protein LOC111012585 isoform X2 [Momordica charantia]
MASIHPQRLMMERFTYALREQGFLDRTFDNLTNLHQNENPLAIFCGHAEPNLTQILPYLQPSTLNFGRVLNVIEQVKGNAISVGGRRVAIACAALQERCRAYDCEGANDAYRKVLWEYYILRDCFHHILQAERTIFYSRG